MKQSIRKQLFNQRRKAMAELRKERSLKSLLTTLGVYDKNDIETKRIGHMVFVAYKGEIII